MISSGNNNLDVIIFMVSVFLLLQGLTWLYKKYFKKSDIIKSEL